MIETIELTKRYGRKLAVDRLTCTVRPGMITGFLGPNGAGKSTTMRLIMGLDHPTAGRALIDGRPYAQLAEPLRHVGALLDARSAHPGRTAYDHLLCLAASNRIGRHRVREVIDLVGLDPVARKRVRGFSLGMSQRLGLATALLGDPPVLVLDEPVNGLDPEGVRWLRELLAGLARQGRTILLSSHLMTELALTAQHLIIIGRGRLLADLSTEEFVSRHAGRQVRIRVPEHERDRLRAALAGAGLPARDAADGGLRIPDADPQRVGEVARAAGVTVTELAAATASLEEAFMALTADAAEHRAGSTTEVGR